METALFVRIRISDPDGVEGLVRDLEKRLNTVSGWLQKNDHLVLHLKSAGEIDQVLADLQACLENQSTRSGQGKTEIVETGFAAQKPEAFLPPDLHLDPVFSFGSGSHPSTRLAMVLLEKSCKKRLPQQVLDLGCGSGILALLAARAGAQHVLGVEIDLESVAAARANVEANGFDEIMTVSDRSLSEIEGSFDLILANLTASVLYRLEKDIHRLAADSARLVVSGLQGRQGEETVGRLEKRGWQKRNQEASGKWQALLMEKA